MNIGVTISTKKSGEIAPRILYGNRFSATDDEWYLAELFAEIVKRIGEVIFDK